MKIYVLKKHLSVLMPEKIKGQRFIFLLL